MLLDLASIALIVAIFNSNILFSAFFLIASNGEQKKINYNPLSTVPKSTINNIILEARKITFPWNYVFDSTVKDWLECMA